MLEAILWIQSLREVILAGTHYKMTKKWPCKKYSLAKFTTVSKSIDFFLRDLSLVFFCT